MAEQAQHAKEATAASFKKDMDTLGIANPALPQSMEQEIVIPTEAPQPVAPPPEESVAPQVDTSTPEVENPEVQPEEERRNWQSSHDQQKSRADMLEEKLNAQNKTNNDLMAYMAGQQTPQQQAQPVVEDKVPSLYDFISKDNYDPMDAMDPSTASGQAYSDWSDAKQDHRSNKTFTRQEAHRKQEADNTVSMEAATKIANLDSRFRNPLTGQPDLDRIGQALRESQKPSAWIKTLGLEVPDSVKTGEAVIDQIGKRAGEPSSVATAPSGAKESKVELPESLQNLKNTYDNLELPAGYIP